jgi:hypothetical protein
MDPVTSPGNKTEKESIISTPVLNFLIEETINLIDIFMQLPRIMRLFDT